METKRKKVPSPLLYNIIFLVKRPKTALTYASWMWKRAQYANYYKEIFIEQHYLKLVRALRPNTTILDLGSCIGDTPIYFAQYPEVVKIIGYEVDKDFYKLSLEHLELSQIKDKDIKLINEPITKERLLEFFKDHPNEQIAIKSDIEGAELEVFKDVEIPDNVYALIFETHESSAMLTELLEKQGFRISYKASEIGIIFNELGMLFAVREQR